VVRKLIGRWPAVASRTTANKTARTGRLPVRAVCGAKGSGNENDTCGGRLIIDTTHFFLPYFNRLQGMLPLWFESFWTLLPQLLTLLAATIAVVMHLTTAHP
jgi:hypothetical protein